MFKPNQKFIDFVVSYVLHNQVSQYDGVTKGLMASQINSITIV